MTFAVPRQLPWLRRHPSYARRAWLLPVFAVSMRMPPLDCGVWAVGTIVDAQLRAQIGVLLAPAGSGWAADCYKTQRWWCEGGAVNVGCVEEGRSIVGVCEDVRSVGGVPGSPRPSSAASLQRSALSELSSSPTYPCTALSPDAQAVGTRFSPMRTYIIPWLSTLASPLMRHLRVAQSLLRHP